MKSQLSFTTIGLVPPIVLLAFATVGHLPSFLSRETVRANVAAVSNAPANHIFCDSGVKGQYSMVHRGWVCSTELMPAPNP
jgi:hypothetical protein